jgi:NAD+ synthase (glutamine-hydrolysing)
MAANLGCHYETIPIEEIYSSYLTALEKVFKNLPFGVAEENLQARIRGTLLMSYSNKFNSVLLATGNRSESSMGYCTLYGDTCGALAPIGGLFKTDVYALCKHINARATAVGGAIIIPQAIIDKSPSAELRPNQKDEDSLPPYETLDAILRLYLCENLSPNEIINKGWDSKLVNDIISTVTRMEFKRIQCPPSLPV